jgi:hypothetical protein
MQICTCRHTHIHAYIHSTYMRIYTYMCKYNVYTFITSPLYRVWNRRSCAVTAETFGTKELCTLNTPTHYRPKQYRHVPVPYLLTTSGCVCCTRNPVSAGTVNPHVACICHKSFTKMCPNIDTQSETRWIIHAKHCCYCDALHE